VISRETRRNLTIFQIFDDKTKELTGIHENEYKLLEKEALVAGANQLLVKTNA
jgi:hypothetical protein